MKLSKKINLIIISKTTRVILATTSVMMTLNFSTLGFAKIVKICVCPFLIKL